MQLEPEALQDFRERVPGVGDDARAALSARVIAEGRVSPALPSWSSATWHGPVLEVGDDIALALHPLRTVFDAEGLRWSAVHCFVRGDRPSSGNEAPA